MSAPGGAIRARATRFDLSATPSHWVPGHPYATHTLDMVHAVLPPAERWFVDVYRDALPHITDDQLRADVEGFIAQEATHAKAHDRGLEHLARHGIDVRRQVEWADRTRARLRARAKRLPRRLQRRLLYAELAAIAAGEHYTAFLGEWILDSPQLDLIGTDPVMLDLLRWHGAEEVEHRSVAFDAYQHVHGGYVLRAVSGALMSVGLLVLVFGTAARLTALDPELTRGYRWRDYREGVRAGTLPRVSTIVRSLRDYLRRDHHPSQMGPLAPALAYLAISPGVVRRRAS
ncbi:MAG: metal-dependent hydrolase [Acidimicrobiales bacterium]